MYSLLLFSMGLLLALLSPLYKRFSRMEVVDVCHWKAVFLG
jgi:hypothetical protein